MIENLKLNHSQFKQAGRSARIVMAAVAATAAIFTAPRALAASIDLSYHGYMRAGMGVSSLGGKQACFNNYGSVGNEFRLGNECFIYGEAHFVADMLKVQNPSDPMFRSHLTLAYFPAGDSQYEDKVTNPDYREINVIEAFAEASHIDGTQLTYWAGKRFYRSVNIEMNDFFYFANMNGTGGGVGGFKLPGGTFDLAVLRESQLVTTGQSPFPAQSRVDSNAGDIGKTALDLRYNMALNDQQSLVFWGVAAYAPPGYSPTNNLNYEAGRGYVAGARHRVLLEGASSFNDFSLSYGSGVMQTLEMSDAAVIAGSGGNSAYRLRAIEQFTKTFDAKWATHFAFTYEDRGSGASYDSHSRWWNIGARPYYALSEHWQLLAEIGHSEVQDDADRDGSGNHIAPRQLTRVTFAPQVAFKNDIFGRPVIRFYVTHSFWNDQNATFTNGGSAQSVSTSTIAYQSQTSGTAVGMQSEIWF